MITYKPILLNPKDNSYPDLFKRDLNNPIITAADLPYPAHTIFNPAATMFENKTLLLARVEDRQGFSQIGRASCRERVS